MNFNVNKFFRKHFSAKFVKYLAPDDDKPASEFPEARNASKGLELVAVSLIQIMFVAVEKPKNLIWIAFAIIILLIRNFWKQFPKFWTFFPTQKFPKSNLDWDNFTWNRLWTSILASNMELHISEFRIVFQKWNYDNL